MCSLLTDFFASVFTEENLAELPETKRKFFGSTEESCDFYITSEMVETKLKGLKQNKSAGVDDIGSKMLIELADVIADIVSCLFRVFYLVEIFLMTGSRLTLLLFLRRAPNILQVTIDQRVLLCSYVK